MSAHARETVDQLRPFRLRLSLAQERMRLPWGDGTIEQATTRLIGISTLRSLVLMNAMQAKNLTYDRNFGILSRRSCWNT